MYQKCGARVVDFHGWALPVQFAGVIEEHLAVRGKAGLFDICHMGEIELSGPGALSLIQKVTINDASTLADGQVQYSAMCYPDGGIVDDITVYRRSADRYLLCVNASNIEKDFAWISGHREGEVSVVNASARTALLALQGPLSERILQPVADRDLSALGYYHFTAGKVAGVEGLISRTGYTGEDGFELFIPSPSAVGVWEALMNEGAPLGLAPIGLGARDTLRLEMKYALYGNDIDQATHPLEAGLGWVTKPDKGDFIGREAILERAKQSPRRKLVGFELTGPGIARSHHVIWAGDTRLGEVTSGTFAPSLKKSIGMGYVPEEFSHPGTEVEVEIRDKRVGARVVSTPFYKQGTAKKNPPAKK
jgi:aminomethyltransferase